ncbi:MAG: tryptophan-rich sensory protein [Candidatus Limnocylindria bacterium]
MPSDRTRRIATVVIFLVTVAINGAANALPINGQTTGAISDRFEVFVIPAGYVFAIWGVIYLGLAVFTVYQALRGDDPVVRRIGWLPALSGVLNTTWLLLFQYELFAATVPVMIALLLTLIAIHLRLWDARSSLTTASRWAIRIPFSTYLGWITVATIANIAQTLSALGVGGFGLEVETVIAAAVLLIGLAIAVTFVRRFGDVAYGLVIVWAYAGIVVKELDTPLVPLVAGAGAAVVAVLVLAALAGRVGPRTGAVPA